VLKSLLLSLFYGQQAKAERKFPKFEKGHLKRNMDNILLNGEILKLFPIVAKKKVSDNFSSASYQESWLSEARQKK
jgi:hypothetical protein